MVAIHESCVMNLVDYDRSSVGLGRALIPLQLCVCGGAPPISRVSLPPTGRQHNEGQPDHRQRCGFRHLRDGHVV
jgi:hypothetical protein